MEFIIDAQQVPVELTQGLDEKQYAWEGVQ
jgi:hypothetical protein